MVFAAAQISWPWFIGAWYDVAGAILLARSFLAATSNQLLAQSSSGYGGFSVYLLRTLCEQKVDARFAVVLLVVGFLLQALAAMSISIDNIWIAVAIAIPLPVIFAGYLIARLPITKHEMRRAMMETNNLDVDGLLTKAFERL